MIDHEKHIFIKNGDYGAILILVNGVISRLETQFFLICAIIINLHYPGFSLMVKNLVLLISGSTLSQDFPREFVIAKKLLKSLANPLEYFDITYIHSTSTLVGIINLRFLNSL